MAPGSQLGLLLVIWSLTNEVVSQKTLQVSPGQNVTLPCNTTETILDIRKVTVEWKINDSYVLVFRSGKPVPDNQDAHFVNRAELADPELKNGNLSLILRKTQLNDSGVYECRFDDKSKSNTRDPKLITNVTLEVKGAPSDGLWHGTLTAAVAAFVVVVFAAGACLCKKRKQKTEVNQNESSLLTGRNLKNDFRRHGGAHSPQNQRRGSRESAQLQISGDIHH